MISPIHILTSAFCLQYFVCHKFNDEPSTSHPASSIRDFSPEHGVVLVGEYDVQFNGSSSLQVLEIACITKHPSWHYSFESIVTGGDIDLGYNAAMLTLKEPIDFNNPNGKVRPVCLMTDEIEETNIINSGATTSLKVSGWGQMVAGWDGPRSDKLLAADLPYLGIEKEICLPEEINTTPGFPQILFDESMMCAGNVISDSIPDSPIRPFREGACRDDYGGK